MAIVPLFTAWVSEASVLWTGLGGAAELAEDEVENAGDLRKFKEDMTLAAIRRLAQRAAVTRAAQSAERTKRRMNQQQNKKVKKGPFTQALRKKKRRAAVAAAASGPAAAEP